MKRQQLLDGPAMLGDASGHRRGRPAAGGARVIGCAIGVGHDKLDAIEGYMELLGDRLGQ